jgi:hypothetical protein
MQSPNEWPREAFTAAQINELIQDAPSLVVGAGLELIDMNLDVLLDLTDDLDSGEVSRSGYADLHGSATFGLSTNLDWQSAIVRPYMTLSDHVITAKFYLGAYFTSTPKKSVEFYPQIHQVTGYDILHRLQDQVGEVYAVAAGQKYLTVVEGILREQGYQKFIIDNHAADAVLPSAQVWELDQNITWLTVVNDLLAAVGYQGIWSDWNGYLRCQQYIPPGQRVAEWYYDAGKLTSMLDPERSIEQDYYNAPNRWVAVQSNNVDEKTPVEGDGIFTFINQSNGPTSVEARDGRTITRRLDIDAASQEALVASARVSIDADMRLSTKYEVASSPNPLHWHFDRLLVNDPDLGEYIEVLSTSWTLPLNGDNMTHEWNGVGVTGTDGSDVDEDGLINVPPAAALLTYHASGATTSLGTSPIAVPYPAEIVADDLLLLVVGVKPDTATVTTPSGWTAPDNSNATGGTGAQGAGTGPCRVAVFTKVAAGTETGTQSVSFANTPNIMWGFMVRLSSTTGAYDVACTTAADNTGGATWSTTGAIDIGIEPGDFLFAFCALPTEASTSAWTSESLTASGLQTTFAFEDTMYVETLTNNDAAGRGIGVRVDDGSSSSPPTHTATVPATNTNVAGPEVFVRVRGVTA